ncbi:3-oxo-tetronate 4-phosphate decarboxylase [Sulfitobacter sp. D35]|uniref:3-oxo-tetronate 4-phosphate decarboxylase n=1 Tax=Sulfitobacter sp. D35 TaxID=3083252 RepID=UPI00296E33A6|nr:3-oxo-tetronate 4-phosphate decarboxylase [Sulfitobacter sp. D35]MDW4499166.1 3-oxo-tetronate 4-phosphate decarboxylase [Sulfitobacter sp. D35]
MSETSLCDDIARLGKSLFDRGLTFGSTGNISVKTEDGWLMTPTSASLGDLDPARISRLDSTGTHIGGDVPTKESFLHSAMYGQRPDARAIAHLHSTHSVAVSCLNDIDHADVLPPLTAYFVMRIGTLPLIPYFPPGDIDLARAVGEMAGKHHVVRLANHGPVVAGKSLTDAVHAIEELEMTAKLFLALRSMRTRPLSPAQMAEIHHRFPTIS